MSTTRVVSGKRHTSVCETPKSPPGDYNAIAEALAKLPVRGKRVKHLNPRQGITTNFTPAFHITRASKMCETPKSPPGDYN